MTNIDDDNNSAENLPKIGAPPISPGNALKHGVFSEILILPGEDPQEFEKLRNGLFAEFKPSGVSEEKTMMAIARAHWQERRLPLYQHVQFLRVQQSGSPTNLEYPYGSARNDSGPIGNPYESVYETFDRAAEALNACGPISEIPQEKSDPPAHVAEDSVDGALLKLGALVTLENLDKELDVEAKLHAKLDRLYKRFIQMKAMKQMAGLGNPSAPALNPATPVLELTAGDPNKPKEE